MPDLRLIHRTIEEENNSTMNLFHGSTHAEDTSWSGPLVAAFGDVLVKLRWTKEPYVWHTNSGDEVFVVLDGIVDMHIRQDGQERVLVLEAGDVLHVTAGDEHVARPRGEVRLLIVERADSD